MRIKQKIRQMAELGVCMTAVATLTIAGCSSSVTSSVSSLLTVTPALGQVYSGLITITGSNGQTATGTIVSGVATVDVNIAGLTPPLLVALTGDPANSNQLVYFDENTGGFASSVVSTPASAIRAIIPSVTGLSASGVGVTPLTDVAVATVANASGVVDITGISVASAVGANTAGLAMAQKLSGGATTIGDVLSPPTPVNSLATSLGTVLSSEVYAKVLHTLAHLPATYGANAYEKARTLSDNVTGSGVLPATFNADAGTAATQAAASAVAAGAAFATLTPSATNADFKAMMLVSASNVPTTTSTTNVAAIQAIAQALMPAAFNATSGVAAVNTATIPAALLTNIQTAGTTIGSYITASGVTNTVALNLAALSTGTAAASGLSAASAVALSQAAANTGISGSAQ